MERNIFEIISRIDENIPADHPVRDAGWNFDKEKMINKFFYFAPEIRWIAWTELSQLCIKYLQPYSNEDWAKKINDIISNNEVLKT